MKNLDLLPVSAVTKDAIEKTDSTYRRFKKIRTDVLEVNGNTVTVRIEQFESNGAAPLTPKELIAEGKDVFSHAPDLKIQWRPLEYQGNGLDVVSPEWVKSMLKKKEMTQQQLADDLGVDRHVLSKLLTGSYEFTRWHRAAFWYYFK